MNHSRQEITGSQLFSMLDEPDVKIIDIRPVEAYNGWRTQNEVRGGHIRNAKSLPYKWTAYIDWIEVIRFKEIGPEHRIVVYGYDREQTESVADRFRRSGYEKVSV